jgi:PAS domain-containing protein
MRLSSPVMGKRLWTNRRSRELQNIAPNLAQSPASRSLGFRRQRLTAVNTESRTRWESTVISPMRILHLEDDPKDRQLIRAALEAEGLVCHITRVKVSLSFRLRSSRVGLTLFLRITPFPPSTAFSALKITKEIRPELPFIFVTGTLGEEAAIEASRWARRIMSLGRGFRGILPAVQRTLREAGERTEHKRAEEALRRNEAYLAEAQKLSHTGRFGWQVSSGSIYWSEETFGYSNSNRQLTLPWNGVCERIHPEDRQLVRQTIDSAAQERKDFDFEHRLPMPDRSVKYVRAVDRSPLLLPHFPCRPKLRGWGGRWPRHSKTPSMSSPSAQ